MTERCVAVDRPADFLPRFLQPSELSQCYGEVAPVASFVRSVADRNMSVGGLAVEGRRFRLSGVLIRHTGLMPDHGDGARFVQLRELLAGCGKRRQRFRVATLQHADGPQLAFADGDLARMTMFFGTIDGFFVSRRRVVQPT